jgi:hypothetical protein
MAKRAQAHARTMPQKSRDDVRNLAIIAHVDHGKTGPVDAPPGRADLSRQRIRAERVMDSIDLSVRRAHDHGQEHGHRVSGHPHNTLTPWARGFGGESSERSRWWTA